MKKLGCLLLALVLCVSLVACGGSNKGPGKEQLENLTNAYNQVATLYNEVATNAQANGWMEDEGALFWLQSAGDLLDEIEAGLPEDVDMDFLQRRLRGGMANTRDLIMMVTIPNDVANDGGVG